MLKVILSDLHLSKYSVKLSLRPPQGEPRHLSPWKVFLPSLGATFPQTPFPDGADLEVANVRNCDP